MDLFRVKLTHNYSLFIKKGVTEIYCDDPQVFEKIIILLGTLVSNSSQSSFVTTFLNIDQAVEAG